MCSSNKNPDAKATCYARLGTSRKTHSKSGSRCILKLALVLLTGVAYCQIASAQQSGDDKRLQAQISDMNGKVKLLEQKQQLILAELTAMKKLLLAHSATVPSLQLPPSEDIKDDPVEGAYTASAAVIEFTDFQCPFCKMFVSQTYSQILSNYVDGGKVRFFYRDFPSPMHPLAMSAARAARCAQEQGKFWQMHDSLFADQDALAYNNLVDRGRKLGLDVTKYNQCLSSNKYTDVIQNNVQDAEKIGIMGTPTFFVGTIEPDGHTVKIEKEIEGAQPYSAFKSILDGLLAPKQQPSAASKEH